MYKKKQEKDFVENATEKEEENILQKKRSSRQNKALWLYFEHLAEELNFGGLDMKVVLKPSIDISWTKQTIHDYLWVPIQTAQLGKKSTTQLTTKEIDVIYDTITRHLGEKFGIFVSFPSEEELSMRNL